MKRIIGIFLIILILINTCATTAMASSASSESKNIEEANLLLKDLENNGRDYYLQYSTFDDPVFVNIAKSYLDNKPQFYLTNAWSDILNEEYRRKGTFKNEYIYDLIIMGFLKFEADADTYNESLINREKDFATDLYSELGDKVGEAFDESALTDSTWENFYNAQTINDLNTAISIVEYAGESYESYCNIMASKMALLESKRDKLALFRASVEEASNYDDKDYINAMNLIIDSIDKADPTKYLNKKTGVECTNVLISVVEDVVKEVNPIFAVLDLSVSGIDLLFGSSDSASNDIKLAYLYLADVYLHQGLRSIAKEFMDSNYNDPSKRSSESARQFIDAFKTYLRFQQYGNNYADEWLDNYIQVRSGFIKRWFHKKEIQNAKDMKEQCKDENTRIDNMLKNINALEKEEDVWKIIPEKKEETVDSKDRDSEYSPYNSIVDKLLSQYGSLRIVQNNGEWQNEANGLCYLNLIDFTGDGNDELFAVCKNDDEDHYTGFIYTLNNGKAELIYENPQIEYNTAYEYDIVYMGYTKDTGFIFGTGWDAPDIDDRTFYWYKDGNFEPVYRSKGYYDDRLEEEVIEEELKIVDIFDDEHIDELWNSFPRVTLRMMGEDDENGNYFGLSELQKSIDDVIRRLDVTPAELPPEVILPGMDVIADAEIYFCLENEIDQWEPSIENDEYFWSVIGNYGLSEPRIDDLNPIVTGDIGDAFILDKSIIENAAYACFSDFSGSLPQFRSYPDMWLVREVGEQTVTLGYGELGVMTERKNYEVNKDKSLDVIYTASYFQDEIEPIADYSVHMVENPNYDKENEFFTYYYTVTNIEKIKDYTETPATADEEAENDGVDPAITDISQVIDMNLTAAEAAHELGLNYEVEDDSEYYFYADSSCDESQGMLWCYGYQYDQNNNWKYHPGDSGISVYGLKNEMSEEELSSIVNKTHFIDVADYFGGDENDKFYYDTNQNEFVIAGKVQNGAVTDLTVFNSIDY